MNPDGSYNQGGNVKGQGRVWVNINNGCDINKSVFFEKGGWKEYREGGSYVGISVFSLRARYNITLPAKRYKGPRSDDGLFSFALARLIYSAVFSK